MMFAGDEDLICNYKGIERLIGRLQWSGGQGLAVSYGFESMWQGSG
jgi:carboxypeptidase D